MIIEFQKDFRWLSNFEPVKIEYKGITYPSVEAAYMSAKSTDAEWKNFCTDPQNSPGKIKRKSKALKKMIENWDSEKLIVMRECVTIKFKKEPFRTKLLQTGTAYIQEGNRWGDKFWGVCLKTNSGRNELGKMIMEIRKELQ